jgi:hypothetical protein
MSVIKKLVHRIEDGGDTSAGTWNLAADLIFIAAVEASRWTHRFDDAMRIPDMLSEAEQYLRRRARAAGGDHD